MCYCCSGVVFVLFLLLAMLWAGLWAIKVAFPGHFHFVFYWSETYLKLEHIRWRTIANPHALEDTNGN